MFYISIYKVIYISIMLIYLVEHKSKISPLRSIRNHPEGRENGTGTLIGGYLTASEKKGYW
jgi:hypothetical protein